MTLLELLHQPIELLASAIRERRISIVELTKFCIERIEKVSHLNAVTQTRFEEALDLATRQDADLAQGPFPGKLLLGLPFVLPANVGIAGMRQDMATWTMHGHKAHATATIVQRLMAAGAIPLCLANIAELGLGSETSNPIYGRTGNPWRRGRSPGGSNGGVAALVAAGVCPFGVANDFGASLRLPAAFCGLYAHKPSRGVVPLTGQYPFFRAEHEISWRALDGIGPITHNPQDLPLILDIIAGPCAMDPMSMTGTRTHFDGNFEKRRVAVLSNPRIKGGRSSGPEVRLAIRKAAQLMQEAGAEMVEIPDDIFWDAHDLWRHSVHRAVEGKFRQLYGGGAARKPKTELLKIFLGQGDHSLGSCLQMMNEEYGIDPQKMRSLDSDIARLRHRLDLVFADASIILMPTFASSTPRHFFSVTNAEDTALASVINALGFPATTAPMGVSGNGLPVAVQIIAPLGCDSMTLDAAKIVGSFIPPSLARS